MKNQVSPTRSTTNDQILGMIQQSIPFSIKESSHYERLIMYLFIKPIMYSIVFRKLAARNNYCQDEW